MMLITSVIIFLILIALKSDSKVCDFEIDISVKGLKVKLNTIEKVLRPPNVSTNFQNF